MPYRWKEGHSIYVKHQFIVNSHRPFSDAAQEAVPEFLLEDYSLQAPRTEL
ncbi:hypothetical protein CY34DRAFT_19801 [Suillus luteus UH-Slu-Lm8-n1]|uniref:Uncharacterized protein n=1 Tax=Suillus luteus UH-Slu-Lm8-n1 TaxID=930992 RepID=A0A0D0ABG2_9AGAM|nr:hypothetical protein CY34DRAFT_19801 [Suillus luteus UH-Slu-Lm8-n1]